MPPSLEAVIGPPKHLVNRVLDEYWRATDEDVEVGLAWYDAALAEACALDQADGRRGAGVIAALSPLAPWGKNLARARATFERGTADGLTFGMHTRKANRILAGEAPLDVLSGPKVRAFFRCIIGDGDVVCIDRHALDIATGRYGTERDRKVLDRAGAYEYVAASYVEAAKWVGMEPRHLQAITWTSHRNRKGLQWADDRSTT